MVRCSTSLCCESTSMCCDHLEADSPKRTSVYPDRRSCLTSMCLCVVRNDQTVSPKKPAFSPKLFDFNDLCAARNCKTADSFCSKSNCCEKFPEGWPQKKKHSPRSCWTSMCCEKLQDRWTQKNKLLPRSCSTSQQQNQRFRCGSTFELRCWQPF